jgi:hypothetical protein
MASLSGIVPAWRALALAHLHATLESLARDAADACSGEGLAEGAEKLPAAVASAAAAAAAAYAESRAGMDEVADVAQPDRATVVVRAAVVAVLRVVAPDGSWLTADAVVDTLEAVTSATLSRRCASAVLTQLADDELEVTGGGAAVQLRLAGVNTEPAIARPTPGGGGARVSAPPAPGGTGTSLSTTASAAGGAAGGPAVALGQSFAAAAAAAMGVGAGAVGHRAAAAPAAPTRPHLVKYMLVRAVRERAAADGWAPSAAVEAWAAAHNPAIPLRMPDVLAAHPHLVECSPPLVEGAAAGGGLRVRLIPGSAAVAAIDTGAQALFATAMRQLGSGHRWVAFAQVDALCLESMTVIGVPLLTLARSHPSAFEVSPDGRSVRQRPRPGSTPAPASPPAPASGVTREYLDQVVRAVASISPAGQWQDGGEVGKAIAKVTGRTIAKPLRSLLPRCAPEVEVAETGPTTLLARYAPGGPRPPVPASGSIGMGGGGAGAASTWVPVAAPAPQGGLHLSPADRAAVIAAVSLLPPHGDWIHGSELGPAINAALGGRRPAALKRILEACAPELEIRMTGLTMHARVRRGTSFRLTLPTSTVAPPASPAALLAPVATAVSAPVPATAVDLAAWREVVRNRLRGLGKTSAGDEVPIATVGQDAAVRTAKPRSHLMDSLALLPELLCLPSSDGHAAAVRLLAPIPAGAGESRAPAAAGGAGTHAPAPHAGAAAPTGDWPAAVWRCLHRLGVTRPGDGTSVEFVGSDPHVQAARPAGKLSVALASVAGIAVEPNPGLNPIVRLLVPLPAIGALPAPAPRATSAPAPAARPAAAAPPSFAHAVAAAFATLGATAAGQTVHAGSLANDVGVAATRPPGGFEAALAELPWLELRPGQHRLVALRQDLRTVRLEAVATATPARPAAAGGAMLSPTTLAGFASALSAAAAAAGGSGGGGGGGGGGAEGMGPAQPPPATTAVGESVVAAGDPVGRLASGVSTGADSVPGSPPPPPPPLPPPPAPHGDEWEEEGGGGGVDELDALVLG